MLNIERYPNISIDKLVERVNQLDHIVKKKNIKHELAIKLGSSHDKGRTLHKIQHHITEHNIQGVQGLLTTAEVEKKAYKIQQSSETSPSLPAIPPEKTTPKLQLLNGPDPQSTKTSHSLPTIISNLLILRIHPQGTPPDKPTRSSSYYFHQ